MAIADVESEVLERPRRSRPPTGKNGKKPTKAKADEFIKATVRPIRLEWLDVVVEGVEPLVLHRFTEKAKSAMQKKMVMTEEEQTRSKNKRAVRPARDFDDDMEQASYRAMELDGGWLGIPCAHFRNAIIAATATTDIAKAPMKRAVFVEAQGKDGTDGWTPLVKIEGERILDISHARNSGIGARADIRARPRWDEWRARFRVEFDSDAIDAESLHNLLNRAGRLIGIGEGRPDSKMSNGIGWGRFVVVSAEHLSKPPKKPLAA